MKHVSISDPTVEPTNGTAHVTDDFQIASERPFVIGSTSTSGQLRRGVDKSNSLSIDNGALRIAPLRNPGWARVALSYGPFRRANGLAMCVFMLNGHNTAQVENLPESLWARIDRWLLGCGIDSRTTRLVAWIRSGRYRRTLRLFFWWWRLRKSRKSLRRLDENLAVGWFGNEVPSNPVNEGNAFVMHATGPDNGQLWARISSSPAVVLHGVANVPMYFVVVLRERGAAYYAGFLFDSKVLSTHPSLRLLGIDTVGSHAAVHPVITQSTIGQIGFRLDSRVYGVKVASVPLWEHWYGSACAADRLHGAGTIEGTCAETGQTWQVLHGDVRRSANGAVSAFGGAAVIPARGQVGLLHATATISDASGTIDLIWSYTANSDCFRLSLSAARGTLIQRLDGTERELSCVSFENFPFGEGQPIQIVLTPDAIRVTVGGSLRMQLPIEEHVAPRDTTDNRVGFRLSGSGVSVESFETHPTDIRIPEELDLGALSIRNGDQVVIAESFEGPPRELDGKLATRGGGQWRRVLGEGHIDIIGANVAKVRASAEAPNPGRTIFLLDWKGGEIVDLEMDIKVPGTDRWQRHRPRAGFVIWQDPNNYMLLNLWRSDDYGGASISTFFQIDGFEDLYDAIWSNIGGRAWYGQKLTLRLLFDGRQYIAFIDGEPVLFRRLSDVYPDCQKLKISAVGVVVNWEWGNDTGSELSNFVAKTISA
jgi:hypothetical protein